MANDSELIEMLRSEMRSGFSKLGEKLDGTNSRLDENNAKVDALTVSINKSAKEVSLKLNGITSFLLRSEEANAVLENRIARIERRVSKLEKKDESA